MVANTLLESRGAQMFPKLTAAQLARLERQGTRLETRAGETLVELGDKPRGVFVVQAGSVEALAPPSATQDASGYELLYLLTPGDFTGEMSSLRGTPALVRVRVRDAGAVLLIEAEQLRRIVQNDADLSELFMRAFILRRMSVIQSGHSEVLLLGSDHSADTLRLREFLTRNARPYLNIDIEHDADAQALLERFRVRSEDIPVVVCRGAELLKNPSNARVAECLGINAPPADDGVHDLLIIGAGPAGLAAAVYAASEGLDVRMVETFAPGGQAGTSSRIENYLGFPTGISGAALAGRAFSQAQKFGAQLSVAWQAVRLLCDRWPYSVEMADGRSMRGRAILIASGAQYRMPDIANLARFLGRGIYYAATHLEAKLCADEDIVVVGGGNSAGQAAVFLASSCRRVHMLVRSDGLAESMSRYLIGRIEETPNITLHTRTQLTALDGSDRLERVSWTRRNGEPETSDLRHVFLMTGARPNTGWLQGCIALDDHGFVKTGPDLGKDQLADARWNLPRAPYLLESSVPGVFAAGDARAGSVKRIASAVGEGSICVQFVHRVLREFGNTGNRPAIVATERGHAA
jgi:thioredoxin reductase (NADPH)